jgi:iron complex transport system substrate-binding protein
MTKRPRVACIEWLDPLMLAGNWVPDLVQLAGGDPVGPRPGEHSGWMKWDDLVLAKPDVVVLMPCGMNLDRTRKEASILHSVPGWYSIPAVKRARVYVTDGNALFNRPGPRLVASLEALTQILYPSLFESEEKDRMWARL